MILILSNADDQSTSKVIHWLKHFQKPYIRVNYQSIKEIHSVRISNKGYSAAFVCENRTLNLDEITGFWYRRGNIKLSNKVTTDLPFQYGQFMQYDLDELEHLFYFLIAQKNIPKLCSYVGARVNKLKVLHMAASHGLIIPDSFVAQKNDLLKAYINGQQKCITKAISDTVSFGDDKHMYIGYTRTITDHELTTEQQHPLLIQSAINKSYEIRAFYLDGDFYSMAIYSQQEHATSVDSRRLNGEEQFIRQVPITLPLQVRKKLIKLMESLGTNIGAIDLICTPNNEYVFLEVNPVGQYDWMEGACNYSIHKAIAKHLIG